MWHCIKKIICNIVIFSILATSFSCGKEKNEDYEIDLTDEEPQAINYNQNDDLKALFDVQKYDIELAEGEQLRTYCLYDSVVYYIVSNFGDIDYNVGIDEENGIYYEEDNESNNTYVYSLESELRSYNIVDGISSVLCDLGPVDSTFYNIACNGNYLTWEEHEGVNYDKLNVRVYPLNGNEPFYLFDESQNMDFYGTSFTYMNNKCIYWLERTGSDSKTSQLYYEICSYDLETGDIENGVSDIVLSNPEDMSINNDSIIVTGENGYSGAINIYNLNSKYKTSIQIPDYPYNTKCNNRLCIWKNFNCSGYSEEFVIYSFIRKTYEQIGLLSYGPYGLIDDYLLLNQDDKLYCYDINNKTYGVILDNTTYNVEVFLEGNENNIYSEYYDLNNFLDGKVSDSSTTFAETDNGIHIVNITKK